MEPITPESILVRYFFVSLPIVDCERRLSMACSGSSQSKSGLKNLGMTWFMNPVLQSIMNTPALRSLVETCDSKLNAK